MPLISVIIPNYNHAAFLRQRIESVLNQTYQDFEVIILDDCSSDNSKEIIETFRASSKIKKIVYNKANSGSPFRQWKKGIELAVGKYIWIAESDDWAEPNFLEVLVNRVSSERNVGICFCGSNWVDKNGDIGKDLSLYNEDFFRNGQEEITNYMLKYNSLQNVSSALIKHALAKKFIDKTLRYKSSGDWSLYIDILQESNIVYINQKLNNFRWYHNNVSNSAKTKGLWVSEGLRIVARSKAYKLPLNKIQVQDIIHYWNQKPKEFRSFKKYNLHMQTQYYLLVFLIRRILYFKMKNS